MDLSEVVSVTGMPGLFKIVNRRNDGVIVTSLVDGKTQFIATRTNLFSSLDNITIYTNDEPVSLKEVLASIKKAGDKVPFPKTNDDKGLKSWMETILPSYDKEKVHVSDMKKLAKWYALLNEKNLIEELTAEKQTDETIEGKEEAKDVKEVKEAKKESKPKAKKSASTSAKAHTKPAPVKKITTPRKAT
jgi:hypothetical protein